MAGIYNFGMLTAGLPDLAQRQVSTAIKGEGDYLNDQNAWLSDWQSRYSAAPSPFVQTGGGYDNAAGTWAAPTGYYDDAPRKALEAEKARQLAQFQTDAAGRMQNQQAQQTAYNQANGGGFTGGIINASYGTPFAGDSTMAGMMNNGVAVPNDQSWSALSYGGPQGGESQAGFGGGSGMMNSQPAGWGGPFTAKNPWSLS